MCRGKNKSDTLSLEASFILLEKMDNFELGKFYKKKNDSCPPFTIFTPRIIF